MKYTIKIQYEDGMINTWEFTERSFIKFVLNMEGKRYGKQIIRAIVKGERV